MAMPLLVPFFLLSLSFATHMASPPNDVVPTVYPPQPPVSTALPFKSSIIIGVSVLTSTFLLMFLFVFYAKNCSQRSNIYSHSRTFAPSGDRKNSGIDRVIIESLPLFRFSSLRGQKDGLECAVCLSRFEPPELLRLLPKCNHAFHVECVDTWLDAHSTCPLCRYRVDPEDILLIEDNKILFGIQATPPKIKEDDEKHDVVLEIESNHRVSGRHSSAGENATREPSKDGAVEAGNRFSLDTWRLKKSSVEAVGYSDKPRRDRLLLSEGTASAERRVEHRIIVSKGSGKFPQRWSDVRPSDLLYLRSEMLLNDSRRCSTASGSRPSVGRQHHQNLVQTREEGLNKGEGAVVGGGRSVINSRSVSEITGLSRFPSKYDKDQNGGRQQQRPVARWLGWIYPQSQPGVRLVRDAV